MTTPSPSSAATSAAVPATTAAAWQDALSAEHAAIFGYGALGPRLSVLDAPLARAAESAHRALRDATGAALTAHGLRPVPARPDYPLPFPLTTPARAQQFALQLESACAAAWRYVLATAATEPGAQLAIRTAAQTALTASAVRAARWRVRLDPSSPSVAFPGI